MTKTIRVSSLPRIMSCHASKNEVEIEINEDSDAASMGTAVHRVLELAVKNEDEYISQEAINEVAADQKVDDIEELGILSHVGFKAWKTNIEPHINIHTLEVETALSFHVDDWTVTGHPDLMGVTKDGNTLMVVDWKTSRVESDFSSQLKAYGYAMLPMYPDVKEVMLVTVYVRSQVIDVVKNTRHEIEVEYYNELSNVLKSERYNPSNSNCMFCPRLNCEAKKELAHSSLLMLSNIGENVTAQQYAEVYEKIKFVEKIAEKAKKVMKEHIKEHGALSTGDGMEVAVTEEVRTSMNFEKALPSIAAMLIPDEFMPNQGSLLEALIPVIKISKSKIHGLIKDRSEKGMKGKDVSKFNEMLEGADALYETTVEKMVLRKEQN